MKPSSAMHGEGAGPDENDRCAALPSGRSSDDSW